jgi:hypothetical protein
MNVAICPDLRLVYDNEIANGNSVERIDAPAGTECEYAVVFNQPLMIWGAPKTAELASTVKYWECRDSHYAIEAGYFCSKHRHSIAGPVPD